MECALQSDGNGEQSGNRRQGGIAGLSRDRRCVGSLRRLQGLSSLSGLHGRELTVGSQTTREKIIARLRLMSGPARQDVAITDESKRLLHHLVAGAEREWPSISSFITRATS